MRLAAITTAALSTLILVGCSAPASDSSSTTQAPAPALATQSLPSAETPADQNPRGATETPTEVSARALPGELQTALSRDPATVSLLQRPEFVVTRSGAFTLVDFAAESGGEGVRVLLGPRQDQVAVLDAGSANVGCGIVTEKVLTDLGLRCF